MAEIKQFPLDIVGSSTFGRYSKISLGTTYNMMVSDGWLVPTPGYLDILTIEDIGNARGIFNSSRSNKLVIAIDNSIYIIDNGFYKRKLANIDTYVGDVFFAENEKNEIAICDKKDIWIYNHFSGTFTRSVLDFVPGYIDYQNGRFIASSAESPYWRLCSLNSSIEWLAANTGTMQTKGTNCVACVRVPGRGNQLFVFGTTVTEAYMDMGLQLFPYPKISSFNIDYGCLNAATIASGEQFVVWLGINEKSGPAIMYSSGGNAEQISSDGINYLLGNLIAPQEAYGAVYKIDGHLIYQLTFTNAKDNLTLIYDFNTQKFFHMCDKNMNYHIAKKIVYFNDAYYFISFKDAHLYRMSSEYTDYNGDLIQRIRICSPMRLPTSQTFIANKVYFTMEQGMKEKAAGIIPSGQEIDLYISSDGATSFSNPIRMDLNNVGKNRNIFIRRSLGRHNDLTLQFRFYGYSRFVCADGFLDYYQ